MRRLQSLLAYVFTMLAVCAGGARANWYDDCPAKASAHGAIGVTSEDAQTHRIGDVKSVRSEKLGLQALDRIEICLLVDADGKVAGVLGTLAEPSVESLAGDAGRAVRGARYTPFERNGKRAQAVFVETVRVLPLERRPDKAAPMPALRDPSTLSIRLGRTACFGTCPTYTVELGGNGAVRFRGEKFVALPGEHHASVAAGDVRALFERFRQADFFRLYDTYRADITNSPAYVLTLRYDGRAKTVLDYVGMAKGMPDVVTDLENEVDRVAGTRRWINYGPDSLAVLKQEKVDFRAHPELLEAFARYGDAPAMRALIAAGTPVRGREGCDALATASYERKADVAEILIRAGARVYMRAKGEEGPCNPLEDAASANRPDIARMILAVHPPQDALDGALLDVASGSDNELAPMVPLLIRGGARLEARDPREGRTPLMHAMHSLKLTQALLAAGADVGARDKYGRTALFLSMDWSVTESLLKAGSDPWARDNDGRLAVDSAFDCCVATLKDWMASHPRKKSGL